MWLIHWRSLELSEKCFLMSYTVTILESPNLIFSGFSFWNFWKFTVRPRLLFTIFRFLWGIWFHQSDFTAEEKKIWTSLKLEIFIKLAMLRPGIHTFENTLCIRPKKKKKLFGCLLQLFGVRVFSQHFWWGRGTCFRGPFLVPVGGQSQVVERTHVGDGFRWGGTW